MALDTPKLIDTARTMLRDRRHFFTHRATGHGLPQAYRLPVVNVDPDDLTVLVDGDQVLFELESTDGFIRFQSPPPEGAQILVEGYHWEWFTDEELERYVGYAVDNYAGSDGVHELEELVVENQDFANTLAVAALVEALWAAVTETARQIDVSSPEVSVPLQQRYRQLREMLDIWTATLREREAMLNVGRNKIEMFTYRRVSRTTGRLVPVYKPQEFDDRRPTPQRVKPPIDNLRTL